MQINLDNDSWNNIFQHFKQEDILEPFAQVCVQWNRIAYQRLKELGNKLIATKVFRPGNYVNPSDAAVISWTLDATSSTPKLISKFIRSKASELTLLRAIRKSKPLSMTNEQIMDAIDLKISSLVFRALVCNNPETSKRGLVNAIALRHLPLVRTLLHPDTPKFVKFSEEWLEKKATAHNALDFLKKAITPLDTSTIFIAKDIEFSTIYELSTRIANPINVVNIDLRGFCAEDKIEYQHLVDYFPYLQSLRTDDKISELSFRFISQLYDMDALSIKSDRLHDLATLGNLKCLTVLELEDCSTLRNISSEIKKLESLQTMKFINCSFSAQEFNLSDLSDLHTLNTLILRNCKIEGEDEFYKSLKKLITSNHDLKVEIDYKFFTVI